MITDHSSYQHCVENDMAILCDLHQIDHSNTHVLFHTLGGSVIMNLMLILRLDEIIHVKCLA